MIYSTPASPDRSPLMRVAIAAALVFTTAAPLLAQVQPKPDTVLQGRPDAPQSDELDPAFISLAAGISVRPPPGGKMIRRTTGGDEIVRFGSETANWMLVVSRVLLTDPVPLTQHDASNPQAGGFADTMAAQMPSDTPGRLIRSDLQPINGFDGALLASRFSDKGAKKFMQRAIIRRTDKAYYVLTYTTQLTQDVVETDPAAQKAIDTFAKVIDTVNLLDQQKIADDQVDRLVRTRALLVNWTPDKVHAVLVPEQWLRLIKDGKDIGYTYIVEEQAGDIPRKGNKNEDKLRSTGVRIGIRSRTVPQDGTAVDAESWMWVQDDRKREVFNNLLVSTERGKEKEFSYAMDAGMSVRQDRVIPVKVNDPTGVGQTIEKGLDDAYTLKVVSTSKSQSLPPVDRTLDPWYLSQALIHLMPRLLPLGGAAVGGETKTYMFESYVPEMRQVMQRYVDVMPITNVKLGETTYTAIPVRERAGLEGSATTHYISPEGKYLGSVNEDNHIVILASDEKTLRNLWKEGKFERPSDVDDSKK